MTRSLKGKFGLGLRNLSLLPIIGSTFYWVLRIELTPRRCAAVVYAPLEEEFEMSTEFLKKHECGQQWTALERPDVCRLTLQGKVTLEECRQIKEAHLEYARDVPYFFYLIDLTSLEDLPPAVRKEASETVKLLPLRGTVVKNAPLRAKVLARLLLTAANLFRRGPEANPLVFVETEEEAQAWYEKRRQQIGGEAAA